MSIRVLTSVALALALPLATSRAQDPNAAPMHAHSDSMAAVRSASLKWSPLEAPGFKPGAEMVVVSGDPGKPAPYTMRLRFPSGYAFPAHYHPNVENVTVLSGRFQLGMGERTEKSALKTYAPGDFLSIPPRMPHFGRVDGTTVVQLHGTGPFEMKVVENQVGAAGP